MDLERIRRHDEPEGTSPSNQEGESPSWWGRYRHELAQTGLSDTAIQVVDLDSDYILNQGIFGAGEPSDPNSTWPPTRLRRGLVMGSVQSGKTASLVAVTAKALDRGVNIVVILGGTRIALWRQSYERIITQLDVWSNAVDSERRSQRVLLPSPAIIAKSGNATELDDLYFETPNRVRKMLSEGRPLVAVVMKQADHLMRFGKYLHDVLEDTFSRSNRSLHMLLIDDEADDGSILDSDVESGLTPDSDGIKQIPRHIARLWSGHQPPYETLDGKLFATYLAYTATPQANFLQSDHNPLSPSNFLAALRAPLDNGSITPPRSTTYAEPLGVSRYYTGGELFYRRLAGGEGSLCLTRPFPQQVDFTTKEDFELAVDQVRSELLSESLRAYFVSGAIRLLQSDRRLSTSRTATPDTKDAIRKLTPSPHSMLYHPSARIDTHFLAAEEIAAWSAEYAPPCALGNNNPSDLNELPVLNAEGLSARLDFEEPLWKRWLVEFERTRERLSFLPSGQIFPRVDETKWPDIRRILVEEVFPFTRLTVINSDPRADDRPQFQPDQVGDSLFVAPRDIFTIFVSGNVMARGITLEGLSTTLFLRAANEPLADTQMQMQRWFGYRGAHLNWCRVFMFDDQLELFRAYHESDEALRREIVGEMNMRPGAAPGPLVLQGPGFRATGKIANLRALPLCPGSDPFVRLIESGKFATHNAGILANLLDCNIWNEVVVSKTVRGTAMGRQLGIIEVAELLESFRYSIHDPSPTGPNHDRWRALASEIGLEQPEAPLFRPPNVQASAPEADSPSNCPYSIAAYLRLWNSLLTRRARGIYPTDDRRVPWSMINLNQYAQTAPKFYVGIRYGSAGPSNNPRLKSFGVLRMDRSCSNVGLLNSTWGSRNPGAGDNAYLGDQLFDYHIHHGIPPLRVAGEPIWRRRGAPGLVLFHVIRVEGGLDTVTVGLALPAGGPDHIAALRPWSGE